MQIACLNCGRPYPAEGTPYQCQKCGGLFDDLEPMAWHGADPEQAGIWRYAGPNGHSGVRVTLGEGTTPLLAAEAFGREVFLKCEYANPTGSFKDRGTAALVSFLASRGVQEAVEDSSGNAGASFAAYAASAGIKARVYIPQGASGPKRRQIEKYGAETVEVPGPRSNAGEAARTAAAAGSAYASHAYLPYNLFGYATCAFEIVQQLGQDPGALIVPAGQGGLLLGMGRGFAALRAANVIQKMPVFVGVQAARCAPLAALFEMGVIGLGFVTEGQSWAEGVIVRTPMRAEPVVRMVRESGGLFVAVAEQDILPGRDALAQMGFYVEPTSALIWKALAETVAWLPKPVVIVLTGSGYKVRAS